MILDSTIGASGTPFSGGSNDPAPGHAVRIQNQDMSRAEDRCTRRRSGLALAPSLLAGLLLLALLTPPQLCAQTNTAKAAPSSHRWLLIVETSHSMQRRSDAVFESVQGLLTSGMSSQLRPGDTLGVWTYNADLYSGRFQLQTWSPETRQAIVSSTLVFLKSQKYEKKANFDKVLPVLTRVIGDSRLLTVLLVSSGDEKMRGTPFDAQINEYWQKWHDQQQKARMPFVTILRAKAGKVTDCTIDTPPWPIQLPSQAKEPQVTPAMHEKLLEVLHNPPPPTAPPLIISGRKRQPEPAPATKPQPAVVKAEVPAPVAAVPSTNNLLAAQPPAPVAPPVQMAKAEVAQVTPVKPLEEVAPKPLTPPALVPAPKVEAVRTAETKPSESAPVKPAAALTAQTPPAMPKPAAFEPPKSGPAPEPKPVQAPSLLIAPPATQAVTVPALRPNPSSVAKPPSSIPAPPAQAATAIPVEAIAGHRNIWIAALVLAGVTASLAVLLLRRSRTTSQASLITQSFERKNKP